MNIEQFAPAAVIAVAYALTEFFKAIPHKTFVRRFIWLPSVLTGIAGAVALTPWGDWQAMAWNALQYASVAPFVILVVKRIKNE